VPKWLPRGGKIFVREWAIVTVAYRSAAIVADDNYGKSGLLAGLRLELGIRVVYRVR
jgi:hypothetical protein